MADVSGSFSANAQTSDVFIISSSAEQRFGRAFSIYLKPSTFVGSVVLERTIDQTNWYPINAAGVQLYAWSFTSGTGNISESCEAIEGREFFRLRVAAFTSGTLDYVLSSAE